MATEGGHFSDYDPAVQSKLLSEAARVVRSFSFLGGHVVIVGGLVPSLLIPRPESGIEPHIGTLDLDLCLSVALIKGEVGNYERLEGALKDAGFKMLNDESWRWKGGTSTSLVVEFFCPPVPNRATGTLYRPGGLVGGKLSALCLKTGALIDRDFVEVDVEVVLPGGGGRTRQPLKVARPAAYLASKADALRRRDKGKDAYDVIWLVEAWPNGQVGLASELRRSVLFEDPLFQESLRILEQEFSDIDAAGARKYASFMRRPGMDSDQIARRAVGAIRALRSALETPRSGG